jgi:hypothetical protein
MWLLVFQALTLTCSTPVSGLTGDLAIENYYSEYKGLWENILDPFRCKSQIIQLGDQKKEEMRSIIYDELMTSVIRMIQRLSLQHVVINTSDPRAAQAPAPGLQQAAQAPVSIFRAFSFL